MKAISLWQPWATLIALGHKRIETRSWGTSYRGLIAIHAAKRKMTWDEIELLEDLNFNLGLEIPITEDETQWPRGAIVAVAHLSDCYQMTTDDIEEQTVLEEHVGGWAPGRYAWVLRGVAPINPPVPARGAQGLWEWNPGPYAVVERAATIHQAIAEDLPTIVHCTACGHQETVDPAHCLATGWPRHCGETMHLGKPKEGSTK